MKRSMIAVMSVGLMLIAGVAQAAILFDRGLPTANLNNTAGTNRSNVAWADWESSSAPTEYWVNGDDFTLAGSGFYNVTTIRVWSTDSTGLSLLGGLAGGPITTQSSTYTVTPVTYIDSTGYQGYSGAFRQIYQLDFSVAIALNGGQTFQFFLDGPWNQYSSGGYVNAFLHASNALLSGSTQEGADDTILQLHHSVSGDVVETWSSLGNGWDKTSDANVEVFGAAVPEPATIIIWSLLGGLGMVFAWRKRHSA